MTAFDTWPMQWWGHVALLSNRPIALLILSCRCVAQYPHHRRPVAARWLLILYKPTHSAQQYAKLTTPESPVVALVRIAVS